MLQHLKPLTCPFGKRYQLRQRTDNSVPKGLEPIPFSDPTTCEQFIKRLNVAPGYWATLAAHLGLPTQYTGNHKSATGAISRYLCAGRGVLFELPSQTLRVNSAPVAITDSEGKTYQFTAATQVLLANHAPRKPFANLALATEFVENLSLSEKQLTNIAEQANLGASSVPELAKALQEQTVSLFVQNSYTRSLVSMPAEETANIPGNRSVDLAPPPKPAWIGV